MIQALSSLRAFALGLSIGLALAATGSASLYIKGRIDGWAAYDAAANAETIEALTDRFESFEQDLRRNRADGDAARFDIAGATQEFRSIANEISSLADRIDCLSDPRVGVRIDAAGETAAAAIDRAAGSGVDGGAARRGPD